MEVISLLGEDGEHPGRVEVVRGVRSGQGGCERGRGQAACVTDGLRAA
jgi:hypothetical protein